VVEREGELACFTPTPNMPLFFLGDTAEHTRFAKSYFFRSPVIWIHGDFAVRTSRGGFFILGRSDATLNPGGVRIGTAEYYAIIEKNSAVRDSVVVAVPSADGRDEEVAVFVVLDSSFSPANASDKVLVFLFFFFYFFFIALSCV
jgi:acetoacetyl-CoA synthetase